jgi:hypothetical protein
MAIDHEASSDWVQWDKGLISPEIFINEEVYREEDPYSRRRHLVGDVRVRPSGVLPRT